MNKEGSAQYVVDTNIARKLEIALARQAKVQAELFDQTVRTYLWKWHRPCRGKHGEALQQSIRSRNAAFSVVDSKHDPISCTTSITVAFVQYSNTGRVPLKRHACRLDYRVTNPGGEGSDKILLEFGHKEIPFPSDITTVRA